MYAKARTNENELTEVKSAQRINGYSMSTYQVSKNKKQFIRMK